MTNLCMANRMRCTSLVHRAQLILPQSFVFIHVRDNAESVVSCLDNIRKLSLLISHHGFRWRSELLHSGSSLPILAATCK